MLRSIISLCFVLFSLGATAQKKEATTAKKETTIVKKDTSAVNDSIPVKYTRHGLRVGADLYKLTRSFYDKNYKGLELAGDYRLTRRYYVAAELGNENKTTNDDRLNFNTKGTYLKVGFDYNSYDNWLDMENVISIGLRYGLSSFSQTLNNYKIYNPYPYFGPEQVIQSGEEFKGLSASWLEFVLGMKAEVIHNIYVGINVHMNYQISDKKPDTFDNLYIPGFNRTYAGKFGVGFNYTVSYFIPIYKSKVIPKVIDKKPKKKKKKPKPKADFDN
jgi:hypothetical protein